MSIMRTCVVVCALASFAFGGELRDGVLYVDGKPFFTLGSWGSGLADEMVKYGLNAALFGAPKTAERAERTREMIREYAERGIQAVPYLSYGGSMLDPWSESQIEAAASLGSEPNLLAWYTGDDIKE